MASKKNTKAAEKPKTEEAPQTDAESTEPGAAEKPPEVAEKPSQTVTIETLLARILVLEEQLAARPAVTAIDFEDAESLVVHRDELEEKYLAPLLERIERLETAARVGPPPETAVQVVKVRTKGERKRHVCGAGTFTQEFCEVRLVSQAQADTLRAEQEAGTLEVRPVR